MLFRSEITNWGFNDLGISEEVIGLNGSPTQVMKIFTPPKPAGGKVFTGDPIDTVKELLTELKAGGLKLDKSGEDA